MAQGLGPNSPIILQLSRENFDALINRHGQYVRWLSAQKCPCIKENQKVDAKCSICNGNGYIYSSITETEEIVSATAAIDGVVEVPENINIIWIRDSKGNNLEVTDHCDKYATVPGTVRGETVLVKYEESVKKTGFGTAEYLGEKLFRINLPVEVEFGEVQASLLTVSSDDGYTVVNISRNTFEIIEDGVTTDIPVHYEYVDPFVFAILSQNLKEHDRKWLVDIDGDAVMTFPQKWPVYHGDIIIALNASSYMKHSFRATGLDYDKLPSFYVNDFEKCSTIRSGALHEFEPGVDFILYNENQIKWITANRPTFEEVVSINYSYNLAYRVLQDAPGARTSENNRFPRKVALKLYTGINPRETF